MMTTGSLRAMWFWTPFCLVASWFWTVVFGVPFFVELSGGTWDDEDAGGTRDVSEIVCCFLSFLAILEDCGEGVG